MKVYRISNPILVRILRFLIIFNVLLLAWGKFRKLKPATGSLRKLKHLRLTSKGPVKVNRLVLRKARFHQMIIQPGWPSALFNRFVLREMDESGLSGGKDYGFQTAFLEITGKCILNCRHCSFAGSKNNTHSGRCRAYR